MRCNKCGEECRDNQAFCLKCGNPIQVVPDFNLIEAELANNIEELLDEGKEKKEEEQLYSYNSDMPTKKLDPKLTMELKLVDISRKDRVVVSGNKVEKIDMTTDLKKINPDDMSEKDEEKNEKKTDKNNKKKIIITTSIIAAVVLIIVIGSIVAINIISKKNDYNKATYDSSYAKAQEYMTESDYENAIDQLNIAIEKATTDEQRIAARIYMNTIYNMMTEVDEEKYENLLELTKQCPTETTYFQTVARYYADKNMYKELSDFLNSIENEEVFAALSEYTTAAPTGDVVNGLYSDYFELTLTAEEGAKIYYVVHKVASYDDKTVFSTPSVDDTYYEAPIKVDSEGNYVIQAVAVNTLGVSSRMTEFRYSISLSTPEAPVITPASGSYTEYTEIVITAPEGSTIYYTIDDENISTESQKYTEPLQMLVGAHIIRAFVVDKYGTESEIAAESFTLRLAQNFTMAQAKERIEAYMVASGLVVDAELITTDGGAADVRYKETVNIDNASYFIHYATFYDASAVAGDVIFFAFDYNKGILYRAQPGEIEGEYILTEAN